MKANIGDVGLTHLSWAVAKLSKPFYVEHNFDQAISSFSQLYLSQNNITDVGFLPLTKALRNNNILEILDLSENHITNEGAKELLDVLQYNKALKKIFLHGNRIDDKILTDIFSQLEHRQEDSVQPTYKEEEGFSWISVLLVVVGGFFVFRRQI
eukprot:TRINITY_DN4871_c0_g1_i4.p1 TRINITY_DN4871_c0_g1~~TRINITY_DN4871_c0_g1_i4.p1  ORF type:complete len:154 (+),score=38.17 TRINITY_DN4871_c0_g1_i4:288-749(+)